MSVIAKVKERPMEVVDAAALAALGGFVSPARWASIASEGRWSRKRHLEPLNDKLFEIARKRRRGIKTRTIISMPPRMGKSQFLSEYGTGWWKGTFPDDRIILTAYQDDFATEWGQKSRDAFAAFGPEVFGYALDPARSAESSWGTINARTGRPTIGEMQCMGAGGGLMGRGPELMIIDDPIKGREQAESETFREHLWGWYASEVRTRMEIGGAIIIIMQRWHEDDIVGRLLKNAEDGKGPPWDLISLPALAEDGDLLGRGPGEALWPEKMDAAELRLLEKEDPFWFAAQFQQNPTPKGGSFFKREWFTRVTDTPPGLELCRYWDKAASEGKGDYTVGVLMGKAKDGTYYVLDVKRDRLASAERDRFILRTAEDDRSQWGDIAVRGEEEGGSSGKDAALAFVRLMDGFDVATDRVTGDKASRARSLASQAKGGNVRMRVGPWNDAYLAELAAFRDDGKNKHDDQVDASSGAYNELSGKFGLWSSEESLAGFRPRIAFAS